MSSGKGKGKRSKPLENGHSLNGENGNEGKRLKKSNGHDNNIHELNMSRHLLHDGLKSKLKTAWTESKEPEIEVSDKVTCFTYPFTCCQVKQLVESPDSIESLVQELSELDFYDKSNDLYKFRQSEDLKGVHTPFINSFKSLLANEVRPWLHDITGIDFHDTIDLFCARYDYTDYLLCHDDKMPGRRIAYIWYLVPESWDKSDGGALDLFDLEEDTGMPGKVVRSLHPSMNSFAFFEVNHKSFHQVAEVLTRDKTRMSIGGWFHAKSAVRPKQAPFVPESLIATPAIDISEDDFFDWINPLYLDPLTQMDIQTSFETNCEITLANFIHPKKYEAVSEALRGDSLKWTRRGPPNRRSYDALEEDMPDIVRDCLRFLKSDATFLLLSSLTGLNLHALAGNNEEEKEEQEEDKEEKEEDKEDKEDKEESEEEEEEESEGSPKASSSGRTREKPKSKEASEPTCHSEVRRWTQGCYTLLRDDNNDQSEFALDLRLSFNTNEWTMDCGGYTTYLAKGEDEELLTATPEENTLNLVYRDAESIKFVKRVTEEVNRMPQKGFQDIAVTYYE